MQVEAQGRSDGFPAEIPLARTMGMKLTRFEDGEAEITCAAGPELNNSYGTVHGGTLMSLLDIAMIHAARSPTLAGQAAGAPCVTVSMNTTFLRPAEAPLIAKARLMQRPGGIAFCEATVSGRDGQACAHAVGTLRFISTAPREGRTTGKTQ